MVEWLHYPLIWNTQGSLGSLSLTLSNWFLLFAYGILGYLGFASNIADKILVMPPLLLGSSLSSYYLLKKVTNSPTGSFIGSMVFSFNTYSLILRTGNLTLSTAFAIVPLGLLLFVMALEGKKPILFILVGLIGAIVGSYEFRSLYLLIWILYLYLAYHLYFIEQKLNKNKIFIVALLAFIPLFIILFLNAYWILGLGSVGSITNNNLFNRGLFGNGFMNISEALTLFHPFWTASRPTAFIVQPIPIYIWVIPLFSILGLIINRDNKLIVFGGLISVLGIFLTKQVGEPFPSVYLWLYNHLPGFNAFREASKFYSLIALGYSILIASFVGWLCKNWNKTKWQAFGKYLVIIFIATIFLWNTKPLITGEIGTLFIPRHIPDDYIKVKDFVLNQPEYFRTLWVPLDSRWSIYTNNHPKLGHVILINSDWLNFVDKRERSVNYTEAQQMMEVFKKEGASSLLDLSSVKYVFIPLEDKVNDDDFFVNYGKDRNFYVDELDNLRYLKKIDIGTKEVAVYENTNFRPHLYATKEKESIYKNNPFQSIDFKFINPTEYRISLKNIAEPIYLNFSESYHPDWKLRVGDFNWIDALKGGDYFLSDKYHFQNDAGLNSFLINPKQIIREYPRAFYKLNSDGSLDLTLTLYFKSQSYVYIGFMISVVTLVLCLGYLIFVFFKFLKK